MNTVLNRHPRKKYRKVLVFGITAIFMSLVTQVVFSAPKIMTRYVGIDPVAHTAYVYNENFKRFPDNPMNPQTSIEAFPSDSNVWYVGSDFDVVQRNNDGSLEVLSNNPVYSEMIHHIGLFYSTPNREFYEPCFPGGTSNFASLIATGSELTSINFPKAYAYKLAGGSLTPGTWHWENPADVPLNGELYLRFKIKIDDGNMNYIDTNIGRVNSKSCTSRFNVVPGESKYIGDKTVIQSKRRLILINIHVHDHVKKLKLKSDEETLHKFKPENQNIPVEHEVIGQGATPLHSHKGHLTVNSLTPWKPGQYGPIIEAGEQLWVETQFENPHPRDIDSMAIVIYFWEAME